MLLIELGFMTIKMVPRSEWLPQGATHREEGFLTCPREVCGGWRLGGSRVLPGSWCLVVPGSGREVPAQPRGPEWETQGLRLWSGDQGVPTKCPARGGGGVPGTGAKEGPQGP